MNLAPGVVDFRLWYLKKKGGFPCLIAEDGTEVATDFTSLDDVEFIEVEYNGKPTVKATIQDLMDGQCTCTHAVVSASAAQNRDLQRQLGALGLLPKKGK